MILIISVWFAKILTLFLRLTKRGGGTTLPGYLLEKRFPHLFKKLTNQIPKKIIITGTNGKTTTQTLLVNILQKSGKRVLSNISGANLSRGILTILLNKANWFGKLDYDYAVFEIEEGTFPRIAETLDASTVIVTNLFRDQLDAYGEINKTRDYIADGIKKSKNAKVILNADDPKVREISEMIENEEFLFGLDKKYLEEFAYEGQKITTDDKHKLVAREIKLNSDLSTSFKYEGFNHKFFIERFSAPGIYNVYNALAAIQASYLEGVNKATILEAFKDFEPAFGRGEKAVVEFEGKEIEVVILLIKNPAGFSLALKTLKDVKARDIMVIINDNTADGKDVSWLWDSKIETMNEFTSKNITISGVRSEDMLLRVKYALNAEFKKAGENHYNSGKTEVFIESSVEKGLTVGLKNARTTLYILPTYTAMLELRQVLGKRTKLKNFWE